MAITGQLPERLKNYRGQLIMDYYAYNDAIPENDPARLSVSPSR